MAENPVFRDDFAKGFIREDDFNSFLDERERNKQWQRGACSDISFVALEDGTKVKQDLENYYTSSGFPVLFSDTMENTRLMMQAFGNLYPVRSCAMKSILDRANIRGNALKKVTKSVWAQILNHCMQVSEGNALMCYSDGKVSALNGGDEKDYSILPILQLVQSTAEYLRREYNNVRFAGGWFDHTNVMAIWEFEGTDEMLHAYQEALVQHGITASSISAACRLITSDIGASSVILFPMLLYDGGRRMLSLGHPVRLEHRNGRNMEDFDKCLTKLFSLYQIALKGLAKLLDKKISNPLNCLQGVMKYCGFSKKLTDRTKELYKSKYGEVPCTAHTLFFGVNEAVYLLQTDGATGSAIADAQEQAAAALNADWGSYDYPGTFPWKWEGGPSA